jgi:hypothetical protein
MRTKLIFFVATQLCANTVLIFKRAFSRRNQAHRYFAGMPGLRSIVNVSLGVADFFVLPVRDGKQHGHYFYVLTLRMFLSFCELLGVFLSRPGYARSAKWHTFNGAITDSGDDPLVYAFRSRRANCP